MVGVRLGLGLSLALWVIGLFVMYLIIKTAVRDGVREAQQELVESIRAIERKLNGGSQG